MRIWDFRLLPYLPDLQFKGQLRELVFIMHQWRNTGKTNHLLINRVMEYPKSELSSYFVIYDKQYGERYGKEHQKFAREFIDFAEHGRFNPAPFHGWHNQEYLRVCMANLYEKYRFGVGKSKISQSEWDKLLQGYYEITGEPYQV